MERPIATGPAQLEVISPAGEISFFPLKPEGVIRVGRYLENDLVLDSPTLAPVHLLLESRLSAYHLLLAGQAEPVRVNGRPLYPHTPLQLEHLDVIELGGFLLILLLPSQSEHAVPLPYDLISTYSLPWPDASNAIDVQLSSNYWIVDVEQTATCQVIVSNNSAATFTAIVNVAGLAESWVIITPAQVTLESGEQTGVTLNFTPPWLPTSTAGLHPVTVMVTSPDYPGWSNRQDALLTITPYHDFSLRAQTAARSTLSCFQQTGQTVVSLTNKGNCPALFQLSATDESNLCRFEFQLPTESAPLAGTAELRLFPGQSVTIPVRITPPPRPMIKPGPQVYPYTCTAALLDSRQSPCSISGQINQSPWIGPWSLALIVLGVVVGAAFGLQAVLEQLWLRPVQISLVTPTPSATTRVQTTQATATPLLPPTATPPLTYEQIFQQIAPQYGLDWQILAGVAYQESRLNHLAVGRDSDMGLMQILPATWNEWAPKVGVSDPFDPYSNVLVAAAYLAYLRDYCQVRGYHDTYWMLIGYNWGPRNLRQLIESQGSWNEVPEKQRYYALAILQSTSAGPIYQQILTQK